MVNQLVQDCEQHSAIGSFDLEAAIANLLSDSGCHSLELPSCLTPDQRNQAKVMSKQHAELKCESYGFGADRRLHVFKKSATTRVRVKNTFVDGWAASDGDEIENDAIIFRSMPGNMPGHRSEHRPLYSRSGDGRLELSPLCRKPSPSRSVTPDTSPSNVEEPPSFPPGIFNTLCLDTTVVIQGLVRAPAFNGRVGVVHAFDAETGRYDVLLASDPSVQEPLAQWTKVKYENLRPVQYGSSLKASAAA